MKKVLNSQLVVMSRKRLKVILALTGVGIFSTARCGPPQQVILNSKTRAPAMVEMFLEYSGAAKNFGGPLKSLLHVSARPGLPVKVELTPAPVFREVEARFFPIDEQWVRERLEDLAVETNRPDRMFRGCLQPIKMWLIRSDEEVVRVNGCRTQIGWPRAANRFYAELISKWLRGE